MLIDDRHQVAIVHVPKCGGTSITSQLAPFDSYGGAFRRRGEHPQLGFLDYTHIPLRVLATHFPSEFEKILSYDSFALTRDPHTRFASATFHRLQEYGGVGKLDATLETGFAEARAVMAWLSRRTEFHDAEYIHFCPQTDFVSLDGGRVVRNIFTLEDMARMASVLQSKCGLSIDPGRKENTNFASNNRVFSLLHAAKPVYSRLTTWSFRKKVMAILQKAKLQSADPLYAAFRRDAEIARFVEDYYAADFELYRMAASGASSPTVSAAERAGNSACGGVVEGRIP